MTKSGQNRQRSMGNSMAGQQSYKPGHGFDDRATWCPIHLPVHKWTTATTNGLHYIKIDNESLNNQTLISWLLYL